MKWGGGERAKNQKLAICVLQRLLQHIRLKGRRLPHSPSSVPALQTIERSARFFSKQLLPSETENACCQVSSQDDQCFAMMVNNPVKTGFSRGPREIVCFGPGNVALKVDWWLL